MTGPRYTTFDKDGHFLTDFLTQSIRSYTRPSRAVVGECKLQMSIYDPKNREKYLGFGKYLLVRQAKLPDWIGVIYTPRDWPFRATSISAYQAEKILAWRPTPAVNISGTAGALFVKILQYINAEPFNEKPILPNNIFYGGAIHDETLGGDALYHITRIARRAGHDFEITYKIDDNGRLYLVGNWYERAGYDTGFRFEEGYNMELQSNAFQESGELYNYYVGYNDGKTPSTRLTTKKYDEASIAKYGFYGRSFVAAGVTAQQTLDAAAAANLASTKEASVRFGVSALNVGQAFYNSRIGNTVEVINRKSGYDGDGFGKQATCSIAGIEVDDLSTEKITLVMESL